MPKQNMTVANITDKLNNLVNVLDRAGIDASKTYIEWDCSDRSEGGTITCDNVDQIIFDLLCPEKVTIALS
jgi:hypothetical protein